MAARPDTVKSIESVKHYHLSQLHCAVIEMYFKGLHAHKDVEIILCLSGLLRIITPDEEFDLKPGEIAYFNPNQPHSCKTMQVKGSRLLLFQFDPSFCISYYPHMRNLFFPTSQISAAIPYEKQTELQELCVQAAVRYFTKSTGFEFLCMGNMNLFMDILLNTVPFQMIPEQTYLSKANFEKRMERIISYIQDHFSEKITLQEIAERENLTASYLSHQFKERLHVSFQEFVNSLRFEHAVFLLKNTDLKVLDVCIESGFSDSKYLNRRFLSVFGVTPREFRKHYLYLENKDRIPDSERNELLLKPDESLRVLREWL